MAYYDRKQSHERICVGTPKCIRDISLMHISKYMTNASCILIVITAWLRTAIFAIQMSITVTFHFNSLSGSRYTIWHTISGSLLCYLTGRWLKTAASFCILLRNFLFYIYHFIFHPSVQVGALQSSSPWNNEIIELSNYNFSRRVRQPHLF